MSTGVIIALIVVGVVIVAAVVAVAAVPSLRAHFGSGGGGSMRRRFGPEYDRTVARHGGDERAAVRELAERVRRHGSLERRPLAASDRERYEARWTAAQEGFVDSPGQAVAEADRLLTELAGERGFPGGDQYEERLDALSVHHARHVDGYRRVHRAAHTRDGHADTEELREAMVESRALFEDLVAPGRRDRKTAEQGRREPARSHHLPWTFTGRHAKGS
ncbi:hypothetical protein SGFS_081020 [Streptomyces graminofaciens]|uniref:Secreted protein n=1 Tax=Streptomyces graminofaciens TaxID=68212 RepID=A0ABN5VW97_9ACTN|nr:hypothetical protein [Streptomyces graminofaciens]BBC36808.1 hypothetical protein SGFS_081020 [Streptomyces graminofaciens]